jgi:ABC-type phosphate transport system substrate-binding protein
MNIIKVVLLTSLFSLPSLAFAEVAVIVNSSNTATISDSDISRLFLGKLKSFPNGDKAAPVNSKFGGETRYEFEKNILKKNSSQVKAYWSKLIFSGKGKPPKELGSDNNTLTLVASDPTIIGYVDAASVDSTVKVIKTF